MADFIIKKGDTRPKFRATLYDESGVVIDLTGASVTFVMAQPGQTAKVNAAMTIVNPTGGIVEYTWVTADVDTAGAFRAEIQVTLAGGAKLTVPSDRYLGINILEKLAN